MVVTCVLNAQSHCEDAGTVPQTVSAFPSCWTLVHTADLSSDGGSSTQKVDR